ncbi:hypothetical protein E2C01_020692 [Portunus trituberculatus]|uniref:Uncharacterized protein n=1 Tax=Portunus trituberculatus TaxID=210409 RepID=A0A5B7E0K9_PORTR|nr:hypothetical protein [Portunus trituberculatus]
MSEVKYTQQESADLSPRPWRSDGGRQRRSKSMPCSEEFVFMSDILRAVLASRLSCYLTWRSRSAAQGSLLRGAPCCGDGVSNEGPSSGDQASSLHGCALRS